MGVDAYVFAFSFSSAPSVHRTTETAAGSAADTTTMADHSPDASSAHTPVPFAKTVAIVPPADMLVSDVHFEVKAMHGSSLRSFFSWMLTNSPTPQH
jgi:hypothetical protein